MKDIELWNGDCLELMKDIPDKSIDAIITDLPYGVTARNKRAFYEEMKNEQRNK